jgi:subtilisin family serine protease
MTNSIPIRKIPPSTRRPIYTTALCLFLIAHGISAINKSYCFRLYLKDKGATPFRITSPEAFLSPETVERRLLREALIDDSDLPLSRAYLDELTSLGVSPVVQSKWMRTIVVESRDSAIAEQLKAIPFVDSLTCVWSGPDRLPPPPCSAAGDTALLTSTDESLENPYGYAENQLAMLNGPRLHTAGYRGKGLRIALIDAGFMHVDRIKAFASINLLGALNITFPGRSIYREDDHGTKVLSCIAANLPGIMIGSAPEASFLLIKSEDTRGEYPLEEDFWAAAVEYADSIGIDIISSSLGYFRFDNMPDYYYTRADLNGQTAFVSHIAAIAAKKGILLVSSAGNEGNSDWEKIAFPADVPDILTVGGVNAEKEKSTFSSIGMTSDYRIKPDVMALGTHVCVIDASGRIQHTNGTSFSTPIVAGLAACLWQAFPLLKNTELIKLIKESSDRHQRPDAHLGYGIPDMFNAYNKANRNVLQTF